MKVLDLRIRILEDIRKIKAAVCDRSMRSQWRMGNCKRRSERSGKKVLWILIIEANGAEECELGGEIVVVDSTHETEGIFCTSVMGRW
jgi:hypothetical protein